MSTIGRFSIPSYLVFGWLTIACAADSEIERAAYTAPGQARVARPAVRFSQTPAKVGDRVWQQTAINMDLHTTITQAGQIASHDSSSLRRRQQRLIEVVEVVGGRVRRARVVFPHSRQQSPENENPDEMAVQPVEGKSYFVTRQGKRLIVTDPDGVIPPRDEFEIVINSLRTLGLPNPLAEFLASRTIHVGDRLQLPKHLAEQVMGLGDPLGQVQMFELQLKELLQRDGSPCARFSAKITVQGNHDLPMTIHVEGEFIVQTDTSRTVAANLAGPLHMAAREHDYQYSAEGGLQVAIQSRYSSIR